MPFPHWVSLAAEKRPLHLHSVPFGSKLQREKKNKRRSFSKRFPNSKPLGNGVAVSPSHASLIFPLPHLSAVSESKTSETRHLVRHRRLWGVALSALSFTDFLQPVVWSWMLRDQCPVSSVGRVHRCLWRASLFNVQVVLGKSLQDVGKWWF